MRTKKLTVGVTGLNATDNPGPGVSVIRSLTAAGAFEGKIVGLAHDTLDPGIYARNLVDDVFLIPYPSQGKEALLRRLRYIQERTGMNVVLPTLDAELPAFIDLAPELEAMGIGTFLPSRAQLELRTKVRLPQLGERAGIEVPRSKVLSGPEDLFKLQDQVAYPLFLKGPFYGADRVQNPQEAVPIFHRIVARWGYPVIAQQAVHGEQLNVVAVGDGSGGLIGALPMRKTVISENGKGWAGIAIKDQELLDITERFVKATNWRGPFELELLKPSGSTYQLLEVNPRFPAWVYLSCGAGINLPYATLRLAAGESMERLTEYRVGTMFVRIALDMIASLEDLQRIAQNGELIAAEA